MELNDSPSRATGFSGYKLSLAPKKQQNKFTYIIAVPAGSREVTALLTHPRHETIQGHKNKNLQANRCINYIGLNNHT
jgi:hypothetical protein